MRTKLTGVWGKFGSPVAMLAAAALIGFSFAGCGGGSSDSTPSSSTATLPGAPTNFTVTATPETTLSATLKWSPPTSGSAPTSYEIYRSTTGGTVFQPDNHLNSVATVAGQTSYTYIDNAGLTGVATYWVVSAKNASGETPTAEVVFTPTGSPTGGGGGGGDTGFGNNFSGALIFADDVGISGLPLDTAKTWTPAGSDVALIDYNTGLRPLSGESTTAGFATVPYLDPNTIYVLDGTNYYEQQTASTWQGQWVAGGGAPQEVTAKWGDNLSSQSITANSTVRVEMVLSKTLSEPMISYNMKSLYGTKANEIQGTDNTTYLNSTAAVFAATAHLTIQKVGESAPVYDGTLWGGDGPGYMAGEVNVSGGFTYGYVWNIKNMTVPYAKDGTWRLTFSLDPNKTLPDGSTTVSNHTQITAIGNGEQDSPTQVHIDVTVAP